VEIEDRDWSEIERQMSVESRLFSAINAKEGWIEKSLRVGAPETELGFRLHGQEYKLVAKTRQMSIGQSRIMVMLVSDSGNSTRVEVLVDEIEGYREISAREYL